MVNGLKKNFFNYYFNPDLVTEEETKIILNENGVNTDLIEKRFTDFINKLEAKRRLIEGKNKKTEFNKLLNDKTNSDDSVPDNNNYSIAARKQNDEQFNNDLGLKKDFELLKKMNYKN